MTKPRIVIIVTVTQSLATFLAGQPAQLSKDFEVILVSSPGAHLVEVGRAEGVPTLGIAMTRRITPWRDLAALWRLYRYLRRARPSIVQTYTPKAGLLGMLAARMAHVPVRVHGIVGMPLMEAHGLRRLILLATERLTYMCSTKLTCNSRRLREWINLRVSNRAICVLGRGSINGVDLHKYRPFSTQERRRERHALGISSSDCVFVFVGRLVKDKGVEELVDAFLDAHQVLSNVRLVLAGGFEGSSDLAPHTMHTIKSHSAINHVGWVTDVRRIYGVADVFVLPSYREGMPNALLEAAAVGLPVIATDINGCNEIVVPGETGLLVPVRDATSLRMAMHTLSEESVRRAMGTRARERITADFDHERFCEHLRCFYRRLLDDE